MAPRSQSTAGAAETRHAAVFLPMELSPLARVMFTTLQKRSSSGSRTFLRTDTGPAVETGPRTGRHLAENCASPKVAVRGRAGDPTVRFITIHREPNRIALSDLVTRLVDGDSCHGPCLAHIFPGPDDAVLEPSHLLTAQRLRRTGHRLGARPAHAKTSDRFAGDRQDIQRPLLRSWWCGEA